MKGNTKKQNKVKGKTIVQTRSSQSLYDIINSFFERKRQILFVISMILSALMSIFLFDAKVSLNGDDSDYLVAADNFWRHFIYPSGRGMLYPVVISPLVGLSGMNLILIKSSSAIFIMLSLWLCYKSFRDKMPAIILMPSILLVSICSHVFFYAGQTFSEPLFMLFQGLFIYFFSKYFLGKDNVSYQLRTDWRKYLILASFVLCITLTRTIGYGVVGVIILFFAIEQRWRDLIYTLAALVLVFGLFQLFKSVAWPGTGDPYSMKLLLSKDQYNPNLGMEDLPGLIKRFAENSETFLSVFLCQFMGLIPSSPNNIYQTSTVRTLLIYLLFVVSLIILFRRNKTLLFTGLYAGVMCFFSFVLLHSFWRQDRILVVYYPFILLFLLGGVCFLLQFKTLRKFFFVYPLLLIVTGVCTFLFTKNKVQQNLPVLQQNLLGNQLYGLSPDWENFIKGCRWATENLDKDARIASRKPSISKVYTGRDFAGIFAVPTVPLDTLITYKNEGDYTILCIDVSKKGIHANSLQYIIIAVNDKKTLGAGIYAIPNSSLEETIQLLTQNEINYTLDYDDFINSCKEADDLRIYDPDMLVRFLTDMQVDYLMLPKLRINPAINSGMYVNTLHNIIKYISFKYPNMFRTIHTVGNEESCEIAEFIH
jgi:hypothetical protein